jgi:ATP-dependent metalloprotease
MVNQAAIQASREGHKSVGLKEFEWAKVRLPGCLFKTTDHPSLQDKILMGAERKSSYITPKDKLMTAYHEAGHALAALYTPGARSLHKVTCMPRGHSLGLVSAQSKRSINCLLIRRVDANAA